MRAQWERMALDLNKVQEVDALFNGGLSMGWVKSIDG